MRTTLNLDEKLLEEARRSTGIGQKTELIHHALQTVVKQEAARRLISLGGSDPSARVAPRRRSSRSADEGLK
jgi:Arc/MetJ family transcription regulator